jgi:hypothetical protein
VVFATADSNVGTCSAHRETEMQSKIESVMYMGSDHLTDLDVGGIITVK